MSSLAGARTTRTLIGVPGLPTWRDTLSTTRAFSQQFTHRHPGGIFGRAYGSFTKTAATSVDVDVTDTASITATESPVDSQEITTNDVIRLGVTESTQLFNFISVTESFVPGLSETVSLIISGVTDRPVTDTASLTLSESVALGISIDVTDTASLQLTGEAGTVVTSSELVTVTDTASLSVSEEQILNIFTGVVDISVNDTASLALAVESAAAIEARRIDRIGLQFATPGLSIQLRFI